MNNFSLKLLLFSALVFTLTSADKLLRVDEVKLRDKQISYKSISNHIVKKVNTPSLNNTWQAEHNKFADWSVFAVKQLMGVPLDHIKNGEMTKNLPVNIHNTVSDVPIPDNFDPREKWPNCPSLFEIRV